MTSDNIPMTVPSFPWEFDGPIIELHNCTALEAGSIMLESLNNIKLYNSQVDFCYDQTKFKAKCYFHTSSDWCHFIARLYTKQDKSGYIIEFQCRFASKMLARKIFNEALSWITKTHSKLVSKENIQLYSEPFGSLPRFISTVPPELLLDYIRPLGEQISNPNIHKKDDIERFIMVLSSPYDDIVTNCAGILLSLTPCFKLLEGSPIADDLIKLLINNITKVSSARCKTICAYILEIMCKNSVFQQIITKYHPIITSSYIISESSAEFSAFNRTLGNIDKMLFSSLDTKFLELSKESKEPVFLLA
jgi:hypothetical protein